jgi:hypothetical protein
MNSTIVDTCILRSLEFLLVPLAKGVAEHQ